VKGCLLGCIALACALPVSAHASEVPGPANGREVVVVANAEGGSVSIVDARTFRLLREIYVLPDGPDANLGEDDPMQALIRQRVVEAAGGTNYAQDQDISPDGRTLYVSRGHRGDVAAFDIASGEMLWKVSIPGFRSDHMTISEDGRRLYVSALTENVVVVVDTESHEIVDSAGAGQWPHDNHLSGDGLRLYNGSIGTIIAPEESRQATPPPPYQLTVLNAADLSLLRSYEFERGVRPIVITEDERRMYAQLSEFHGIIEFDLVEGRILRELELPVDSGVTEADYDFEAPHHGLAISPDEEVLCAAGRASDYVALVSTATFRPLAIIEGDDAPGWAATGPDGRHCFVANTRADTLSVISYAQRREVARIEAGDGPKQIEAARIPETVLCAHPGVPGCSRQVALTQRGADGRRLRLGLTGDIDAVRGVSFRIGRRAARRDALPPFARVISRRLLARTRARRVRASVAFEDGSLVLSRRLPRCALRARR
jgi:YVTN family beta-propeller protein